MTPTDPPSPLPQVREDAAAALGKLATVDELMARELINAQSGLSKYARKPYEAAINVALGA